jgi:hypothetical protein
MKIKNNQLQGSCLVYIAIFSALFNFSRTVILLSWYIKQAKLRANCSKTRRAIEEVHSMPRIPQVQASLHQEPMQTEVQIPTQVEAYVQLL